jgi:hypothetical protein
MKTQVMDAKVIRVDLGAPEPTLVPVYRTTNPIEQFITEIRMSGNPTIVMT